MKKKISSLEKVSKIVSSLKIKGKKISLCHGVFDLLHPGHIYHFEQAKKKSDILVVSITSDKKVLKGPGEKEDEIGKPFVGDTGNLFLFQLDSDTNIKILSTTFGSVDYKKGEVIIDTVNITGTVLSDNIIQIQAIPQSNDVLARKELYLQFDVSNSNFYMREDPISTGANTSGTRYNPQSSYSNGVKVRGAMITSTSSATTLIGFVNGQPYYGAFHTMANGNKMTGSSHSPDSTIITSTPTSAIDTSSTQLV